MGLGCFGDLALAAGVLFRRVGGDHRPLLERLPPYQWHRACNLRSVGATIAKCFISLLPSFYHCCLSSYLKCFADLLSISCDSKVILSLFTFYCIFKLQFHIHSSIYTLNSWFPSLFKVSFQTIWGLNWLPSSPNFVVCYLHIEENIMMELVFYVVIEFWGSVFDQFLVHISQHQYEYH